jgi:hypothetical protein
VNALNDASCCSLVDCIAVMDDGFEGLNPADVHPSLASERRFNYLLAVGAIKQTGFKGLQELINQVRLQPLRRHQSVSQDKNKDHPYVRRVELKKGASIAVCATKTMSANAGRATTLIADTTYKIVKTKIYTWVVATFDRTAKTTAILGRVFMEGQQNTDFKRYRCSIA